MHTTLKRSAMLLVVVSLLLYACTTTIVPPTMEPSAQAVTVEVPIPVTVEVTRIVSQQIIVEATPTPIQTCEQASYQDTEELVIGAIIPLSTSGDMLGGFSMQAALSIAISELNDAGGVRGLPLRLITVDSGGNNNQAAAAVSRLTREDCAVAIIGLFHNSAALSAAGSANALGVPLVIAGATTDELPLNKYPNVFRIAPSDTMMAEMPAKWLAEVGDYNGDGALFVVGIVDSRQLRSPEIARLEAKFSEFGIEHETLPVDLPASDFSSVIARMVSLGQLPDAILIYVDGEPALEIEQQLREAGFGPHKNSLIVNTSSALDSTRYWQIVPDGVGTVVTRLGPWHNTVSADGKTFALKYAKYFGRWPEYYSFAAYDGIHLIADAIMRSESPVGTDLANAIAETDTILASGHYYFPYTSPRAADRAAQPEHLWNQWPEVHTLFLQYDEVGQSSSDMPVIWPPGYRTTDGPLSWSPTANE